MASTCPICGEMTLQEMHGEYRMELPPNIPGEFVAVSDAAWQHCESCGEDIFSPELEKEINKQARGEQISRAG
jgi:hypothetical protein